MKESIEKFWHIPVLIIAIAVSLYLRVLNPWNSVFSWTVLFSGNDLWYYYRLIENCIHNFPQRLWFDAFTYYPFGTYLHFGPFLVYFSSILAILVGANTSESIRSVLVFIPAIGGTLLILSVYLFTKEAFNKRTGVISAFLTAIVPGQLLHRSMLGFNDHHIWEVFWMITTLGIFLYSINLWEGRGAKENIKRKKRLMAPILAGISFGMYLYAWAPGFILAFMIVLFVFFIFIFKNYFSFETANITYISVITFLTAAVVYSPFSNTMPGFVTMHYTVFQLIILFGSAGVVAIFYGIDILQRRGYYRRLGEGEKFAFPATILVSTVVIIGVVSTLSPDFFSLISGIFRIIQPAEGQLTIAEVQPFFSRQDVFDSLPAWINFGMTFFFAIPAVIYIFYSTVVRKQPNHLLVLIVSVLMLIALSGQNRFAYYFGAISAILAGVFVDLLLKIYSNYTIERRTQRIYVIAGLWILTVILVMVGVEKTLPFLIYFVIPAIVIDAAIGIRKLKSDDVPLWEVVHILERYRSSFAAVAIVIILVSPVFTSAYPTYKSSELQSKASGAINKQWWDSLVWLRNNTPDPGLDYYAIYKPGNMGEKYPYYPETAYGVMSWWDYGHWITAIAHRIPNANPFQQGIGNKNGTAGSAPFFTAFNEKEANRIADELGMKYVISDVEMATGKFYAMATWAENSLSRAGSIYYLGEAYVFASRGGIGITPYLANIPQDARILTRLNMPSENYFRTMEARFHIFDGDGLEHYRMIYESKFESEQFITMEVIYRLAYNLYFEPAVGTPKPEITSTGYVKIFEYVKGGKIAGNTSANEVSLELKLKTNQGRDIVYHQKKKVENGFYEFTVPYAQNCTRCAVIPESPYL